MAETEIWCSAPGYEGFYEISNLGRVRSLDRQVMTRDGKAYVKRGRVMQPGYNNKGYPMIHLYGDGHNKSHLVHHLVAQAFLGDRPDGSHIHHKDDDKANNAVANLEYVDGIIHNHRHAARGDERFRPKLTATQVQTIRAELGSRSDHEKVAQEMGVSVGAIIGVKEGRTWRWLQ